MKRPLSSTSWTRSSGGTSVAVRRGSFDLTRLRDYGVDVHAMLAPASWGAILGEASDGGDGGLSVRARTND